MDMLSTEMMELPVQQLSALPSDELLHVPCDVTLRARLEQLIGRSLVTEFPVNRDSPAARQLSADEAVELLLSSVSPWRRHAWWSRDLLTLLEVAVRSGHRVTEQYLVSQLRTLALPLQNISALGGEVQALSSLTCCSLACNALTLVRGVDLPRSLTSLELYGNPLGDLRRLLRNCPPLQYLGLGKTHLTDDRLQDISSLMSTVLSSLRVLDLCDNHISSLENVTSLLVHSPHLRAVDLSGNPVFLVSGYYQSFLSERGRLEVLDRIELTQDMLDQLRDQSQQHEEAVSEAAAGSKTGKKPPKKSGKKSPQKSIRRPAPDLEPSRFEPSLTCALIRVTGVIYLPYIPKEEWPGQELCAVFQWGGSSAFPPPTTQALEQAGAEQGGQSLGLQPLEALLSENNDVTVLEKPLEWFCSNPRALRDAILKHLRIDVLRREKWAPKKGKGKKDKDKKKDSPAKDKKEKAKSDEKAGKEKKKKGSSEKDESDKKGKGKQKTESPEKEKLAEPAPSLDEDVPPPEYAVASVVLPARGLLRPSAPVLLQASSAGACTTAAPTDVHWTGAIQRIQEEKRTKKAAAKKADGAEKQPKGKKPKSLSSRNNSGRKKKEEEPPKPTIQFFFSIELYRKPRIDFPNAYSGIMPIEASE